MEIEKVVSEEFAKVIESGFIREKIRKNLEEAVSNAISSALRGYSDFGKQVEKAVKESIGTFKFSLPEYNQLICNFVLEIVDNQIKSDSKKQIEENLKEFFKPLEKTEWKVSEIIEEFISYIDKEELGGKEISFHSNQLSTSSKYVYFDEEGNKSKYSCKYRIAFNTSETNREIWLAEVDNQDFSKIKTTVLYEFESFLFKLFSMRATIIDDCAYVDTDIPDYE